MKTITRLIFTMTTGFILVVTALLAYYDHASKIHWKEVCVTLGNLDPDCDQRWIDHLPPRVVLQALCDQGDQFMCDYLAI